MITSTTDFETAADTTAEQITRAASELGFGLVEYEGNDGYHVAQFLFRATGAIRCSRVARDARDARNSACRAFAAYYLMHQES